MYFTGAKFKPEFEKKLRGTVALKNRPTLFHDFAILHNSFNEPFRTDINSRVNMAAKSCYNTCRSENLV